MARRERLPITDPQIIAVIEEIKSDAVNIAKELNPNSSQMTELRLQNEQRDQRLAARVRKVNLIRKPFGLQALLS